MRLFNRVQPMHVVSMVILVVGLMLLPIKESLAAEGVVTQTVSGPFDKVAVNLKRQITAQKLIIVKVVPFQKMLMMVGLKPPKLISYEIFHPRYGKVIYKSDKAALKEVPLRIVIREDGKNVMLEYRKPSVVFAPYSGLAALGKELDQKFANIVAKVAK